MKIIDGLTAYATEINDRQSMLHRAESYRRVASEIGVLIKDACKDRVAPGSPWRNQPEMTARCASVHNI